MLGFVPGGSALCCIFNPLGFVFTLVVLLEYPSSPSPEPFEAQERHLGYLSFTFCRPASLWLCSDVIVSSVISEICPLPSSSVIHIDSCCALSLWSAARGWGSFLFFSVVESPEYKALSMSLDGVTGPRQEHTSLKVGTHCFA